MVASASPGARTSASVPASQRAHAPASPRTTKPRGRPTAAAIAVGNPIPREGTCGTPVTGCLGDLFSLLSQTHMMQILCILIWRSKGPVRFVELQTALGLSPNTLSARLKSLVEAGLVTRTAYSTIPPRVDYEATAKAHDLKVVFKALHEWAGRNKLEPVTTTH